MYSGKYKWKLPCHRFVDASHGRPMYVDVAEHATAKPAAEVRRQCYTKQSSTPRCNLRLFHAVCHGEEPSRVE